MGSAASVRPTSVSWVTVPPSDETSSSAPSSVSSWTPSRIARVSGGSTNGKRATSSGVLTTPTEIICSSTDAREVRRISGSVNSGPPVEVLLEYRRIAMPSATRPDRPLRWLAEACDTGSIGSRCTLVCLE